MKFAHIALPGVAALVAAAAIAPGAASAATCTGVEAIQGQGSSLQRIAQTTLWNGTGSTSFQNASDGCSNLTPSYQSIGSGAGTALWATTGNFASGSSGAAFIGTDDALTAQNVTDILANRSTRGTADGPLTFPVAQAAIAMIVHLPSGCTVSSGLGAGRNQLGLSYRQMDAIWTGSITTWSALSSAQPRGAGTLTGTCTGNITKIVRLDASGTSAGLKRFLFQYDTGTQTTASTDVTTCAAGTTGTWQDLSNGPCNQAWPATVTRASTSGGGGEAASVAATAGSIGYVALPDARANGSFSPATTSTFWAELPVASLASTSAPTSTSQWAEPSTNGDVAASAASNCSGVTYATGAVPSTPGAGDPPVLGNVPTSVNDTAGINGGWASAFDGAGLGSSTAYSACTLTYDLALGRYADYPGTDATEPGTVKKYLTYLTGTNGQTAVSVGDYAPLPGTATTGIRGTSVSGLSLIN